MSYREHKREYLFCLIAIGIMFLVWGVLLWFDDHIPPRALLVVALVGGFSALYTICALIVAKVTYQKDVTLTLIKVTPNLFDNDEDEETNDNDQGKGQNYELWFSEFPDIKFELVGSTLEPKIHSTNQVSYYVTVEGARCVDKIVQLPTHS